MITRAIVIAWGTFIVSLLTNSAVSTVLSGSSSVTRDSVRWILIGIVIVLGIVLFVATGPTSPERAARKAAKLAERRRREEEYRRWWNSLPESERQAIITQQEMQQAARAQQEYWNRQAQQAQWAQQQAWDHERRRDFARQEWLSGNHDIPPTDYFG